MAVEEKKKKMGVEVVDTVHLTDHEAKIFDILVATLQHFELDTELRVAGGWVRDKVNFGCRSPLLDFQSNVG